ncbi:MAG: hypothetical protein AAF570_25830, partial [Bacteroidota bacterium]
YFADMREANSESWGVGLAANVELLALPIPFPWPSFNYSRSRTRIAVTNKIIHRTGIMTGMRAWNEGSFVKTDNLLYDAQTGRPLLTRVTNNYDDPVYTYQMPAFWAYDRMGAAYRNAGLEFQTPAISAVAGSSGIFSTDPASLGNRAEELLIPGDEFIVRHETNLPPKKAWFIGFAQNGDAQFFSEFNLTSSTTSTFLNVRSGRHNLLSGVVQEITTLKNPTINRDTLICYRDITDPTAVIDSVWVQQDTIRDTVPAVCVENFVDLVSAWAPISSSIGNNLTQFPWSDYPDYCFECYDISANGATLVLKCAEPNSSCNFQFVNAAGNAVQISDVDQMSNPTVTTYSGGLPGFTYSGYAVNATISGQTGILFIFSDGNCTLPLYMVNETIVNDYQSTLTVNPSGTIMGTYMWMLDSVLSASAT